MWAKTLNSTAARLTACENIIGHRFTDLRLLQEALNVRCLDSSLSSNKRLALYGDALASCHLRANWLRTPLEPKDFNVVNTELLSNAGLGRIGLAKGLGHCTDGDIQITEYEMATTVEAIIAAAYLDGGETGMSTVMKQLGITHPLLEAFQGRGWVFKAVKSSRKLRETFFVGRHLHFALFSLGLLTPAVTRLLHQQLLSETPKTARLKLQHGPPASQPSAKAHPPPGIRALLASHETASKAEQESTHGTAKGTKEKKKAVSVSLMKQFTSVHSRIRRFFFGKGLPTSQPMSQPAGRPTAGTGLSPKQIRKARRALAAVIHSSESQGQASLYGRFRVLLFGKGQAKETAKKTISSQGNNQPEKPQTTAAKESEIEGKASFFGDFVFSSLEIVNPRKRRHQVPPKA